MPVVARALTRRKSTAVQGSLSAAKRFENLKGAFALGPVAGLEAARILLVDDVLTTGATASEAAGTLKQAGAMKAELVVL